MFKWTLTLNKCKSKYLLLVLSLGLLGFSASSHSSGYLTTLHNPLGTIDSFFNHRDGSVTLLISGLESNPDNCNDTTKVHIRTDHPGFDSLVATAMAAYLSDKKVGVFASGCDVIPFWDGPHTRPIVLDLWIK